MKTKKQKTKKASPGSELWNQWIGPFVELANGKHGNEFKAEVHATLCFQYPAASWTRQAVGQWLHEDPKRRNEPKYGTGKILLGACAVAAKSKDWS